MREVARLADEAPQSGTLGAKDDRGRLGEIDRIVRLFGITCQANGPHVQRLQFLDRTRDVHDVHDGTCATAPAEAFAATASSAAARRVCRITP